MLRYRFVALLTLFVFCVASAALSQEPPAFEADACAKHCREMAAARAKNVDACKAHVQQRDAAWKEIEAQLQLARTSRGDKKVAALEAAVQKLVAYNASAPGAMADCPMMGGHAMASGCCAEHKKSAAGGGMNDCCAGATKDCCGGSARAANNHRCPMTRESPAPSPAP